MNGKVGLKTGGGGWRGRGSGKGRGWRGKDEMTPRSPGQNSLGFRCPGWTEGVEADRERERKRDIYCIERYILYRER